MKDADVQSYDEETSSSMKEKEQNIRKETFPKHVSISTKEKICLEIISKHFRAKENPVKVSAVDLSDDLHQTRTAKRSFLFFRSKSSYSKVSILETEKKKADFAINDI